MHKNDIEINQTVLFKIKTSLRLKKLKRIFNVKEKNYPYQALSTHLAVPTHPIKDWTNCFNTLYICNTFTPKVFNVHRNVAYGYHSMICVMDSNDFYNIKCFAEKANKPIFEIQKQNLTTDDWKKFVYNFLNVTVKEPAILLVPTEAIPILGDIYDMCFAEAENHHTNDVLNQYRVQFYIDIIDKEITYETKDILVNHMRNGNKYAVGTTIYLKNPKCMKYVSLCYPCKAIVIEQTPETYFTVLQDLAESPKELTHMENAIQSLPKSHAFVWIREHGWCIDTL